MGLDWAGQAASEVRLNKLHYSVIRTASLPRYQEVIWSTGTYAFAVHTQV